MRQNDEAHSFVKYLDGQTKLSKTVYKFEMRNAPVKISFKNFEE